jgi:sacsin
MKFKSEEVDFLMESKNLQIDIEDEEFLSSAFPFD